jgi:hypothetical protein
VVRYSRKWRGSEMKIGDKVRVSKPEPCWYVEIEPITVLYPKFRRVIRNMLRKGITNKTYCGCNLVRKGSMVYVYTISNEPSSPTIVMEQTKEMKNKTVDEEISGWICQICQFRERDNCGRATKNCGVIPSYRGRIDTLYRKKLEPEIRADERKKVLAEVEEKLKKLIRDIDILTNEEFNIKYWSKMTKEAKEEYMKEHGKPPGE